jgi:hypothetical protein
MQDFAIHSIITRKMKLEFSQLVSSCIRTDFDGQKPRFPFSDKIAGNWIDISQFNHHQWVSRYNRVSPLELENCVLAFRERQEGLVAQIGVEMPEFEELKKLFSIIEKTCTDLGHNIGVFLPIKKIESFAISLLVLVQCSTYKQMLIAALNCFAHLTDKPISTTILSQLHTLVGQLWHETDENLRTQGKVRDLITSWERMSDSKMLDKLREFMSFCMTFGTLEYFGFSQKVADIVYGEFKAQKRHKSLTSFALAFCDVIEFVFSRLCICVETGSIGPLFHSADNYTSWYDDCLELFNWNLMLGQDYSIRPFSDQLFQARCEDCIEKGKEYIKFAKSIKDRRELTAIVNKIEVIYGDFRSLEIVGKARKAPFSILLNGDSSIGKTSVQFMLGSVFANLAKLPDDPRYIYFRNPNDEFMSGFKSYQWMIVIDDVGAVNPKFLNGIDKGLNELFLYVQNYAMTANMADLNEKGKVAIRPEFVIATTNVPTLNAEVLFSCPSAALRRLPWRVTPTVRPEYRINPGTNMLDPSKCDQPDDQFPDYWTFTVEEIRPKPIRDPVTGNKNLDAEEILLLNQVGLKEFLTWFVETAQTHRARQEKVMNRLTRSSKVPMCGEHAIPRHLCGCLGTQSEHLMTIGVSTLSSFITTFGFMMILYRYILSLSLIKFMMKMVSWHPRHVFDQVPLSQNEWQIVSRDRIGQIGDRAASFLRQRKEAVAVSVILSGVAIWKLSQISKESNKLDSQVKYTKPTPIVEKEKVRWRQEIPIFDRCNVLPQSISTKGRDKQDVLDQISRNVAQVKFTDDKTHIWYSNVLFLGGFDVAINTHDFEIMPDVVRAEFLFNNKMTHIGKNTSIIIDKRGLKMSVHDDVTIVELEEYYPFPSIKELFPKDIFKSRFNGDMLYRNKEGEIEQVEVKNLRYEERMNATPSGKIKKFRVYTGHVSENTINGMCGSPVIADTSAGLVILGIHSLGGSQNLACSSVITQSMIASTRKINVGNCDVGEKVVTQSEGIVLNTNAFLVEPITLTPTLRSKDPLAYRLSGLGEVYGSLSTGPSNPKTKVASTYIREFWESLGFSTDHVPPKFGARCWHKGLDDMMSPDILISTSEANFISKSIARDFIKSMTHEQKEMIEFYDYETAILGADGVIGVDKLDFKTSTGFPMKKCKKTIFKQMDNGKYSVPEEIIESCERIHTNIKNGIRNQVIFSSALKDESRPKHKVDDWSIRIFMGAPVSYCIVMRQHFLSLARVIQNSPLQFETAVGINAHSSQWDVLANTLAEHSDLFIVGDHSKYDKRMAAVYIYNMFKVAIEIIIHCMTETGKLQGEEIKDYEDRLHILAIDTAYAFIDYNGTLVAFLKNHVSGHVLTVIINSFGNSGYIRMAYRRIITDDPNLIKFQSRCKVVTYGDDFIVAVKPEIKQFNFVTMKQAMSTFGVSITPAVKTDSDYEFLPLSEIDFLKRRFVYHEDLQRYVGPLDMKSIQKSLLISLRSDSITPEEQAVYSMMSAQQEMFAYGREAFETFTKNVYACIQHYNLQYLVKKGTFPTYDQLLIKYATGYVHCDNFVEENDDHVMFDVCYPSLIPHLDAQCECREVMRLNNDRMCYDQDFYSDHLERDFKSIFKNRLPHFFRKFIMKSSCSTYGFSCTTFCESCQLGQQSYNDTDLGMKDCQSFVPENLLGFKNTNTLSRVEQPMSTVNQITEGSQTLWSDSYLTQGTNETIELRTQMERSNIEFVDEHQEAPIDIGSYPDPTRTDDDLDSATFGNYLKRPVRIYTTTWDEGTTLNQTFNPWALWSSQPQIKQKLNNYGLFRGRLHVKMLVNASQFFYGAGRLTYEPLIGYMRRDTVGYGATSSGYMVAKSQQKGFEFYPSLNKGGEMILPFFYPKTWVDLTSYSDFTKMGRCSLFSYTPLSNANNVTTASVTITIIAWCEDVEVSAPTYQLAVQSEYSKLGPISGPASAVADAARSLARIPIIKPYALGTEMLAGSLGSVAKYFGFTNVPTMEAQKTMKPGSHYGMATTEISTPYEKLSLDDKNELTIDPRIAGLPAKDEMVISEIIKRESYLTQVPWSATDAASTKLFSSYVTPSLYDFESYSVANTYAYYQTPMAHLSRLFTSWRGSIIFRFQFVCTSFHKGRVRITWDPRYNLSSLTSTTIDETLTTSFTKIVDIGETQNVEIEVPYMQALAFMTNYGTDASSPTRLYSRTTLPTVSSWNSYFNGTISVTVLNAQTSPVTSADIQMLVFVRAGDDFIFANPREAPTNLTFLAPQSEHIMISDENQEQHLSYADNSPTENLFKIHMGESIKSLRQLIHRQTFYNCFVGKAGQDSTSAGTYNRWILPRYPVINGYTSLGRNNLAYANGVIQTTTTVPVSYSAPSVFSMIAPLFIGARGSIVYNINVDGPEPSNLMTMSRNINVDYSDHSGPDDTKKGWYNPFSWDIYNPSALGAPSKYRSQTFSNGAAGRILSNQRTQAGLMAHFPYYSPLRFTSSVGYLSSDDGTILSIPVEEQNQGVEIIISTKNNQTTTVGDETATVLDVYMMAGHDFTFLYYNCVPTFYYYQSNYGTTN